MQIRVNHQQVLKDTSFTLLKTYGQLYPKFLKVRNS